MSDAIAWFKRNAESLLGQGASPADPHWHQWIAALHADQVPVADALSAIKPASMDFLHGFVEFAFADGVVTDGELRQFHEFADSLGVSAQEREHMWSRLQRGAVFSRIRAGDLPRVTPSDIYLDADERCFLDVGALRIRPLKTVTKVHEGRLLASSKKLRFIGFDHGWELAWQKVFNVAPRSEHDLYLQTSQAKSTGFYRVGDAEYAGVIVDTVARIQRREILVGAPGQRDSASIPQHVKTEVWKRDRGTCVECGASSYLEFDHIIPRSKGGATSAGNLQLLCRTCNLRKSDRI